MDRPYLNLSIDELERLFAENSADEATLSRLFDELKERKTKRSHNLIAKVAGALANLAPDEELDEHRGSSATAPGQPPASSEAQSSKVARAGGGRDSEDAAAPWDDRKRPSRTVRIRPPGTKGLPDAWARGLAQDLHLSVSPEAELPEPYIEALGELIKEIRRTGSGQKRYELEKGERVASPGRDIVYAFPFREEAGLFEDARVEVEAFGRRVGATVVSITDGQVLLVVDEDLGQRLSRVTLVVDATALLEGLKERLEGVKVGDISLNRTLANAVVGRSQPPDPTDAIPAATPSESLNRSQDLAYQRALRDPVSYIWGPPGCGKTRTLAPLVRAAFEAGKRVLVCSNTNKAVDQVLHRICIELGTEHEAMKQGHVLRLGRISDDKLLEFAAYVTLDGIVERLSVDLRRRLNEIQEAIARIDARVDAARQTITLFETLDAAERNVEHLKEQTNRAARAGDAIKKDVAAEEVNIQKLRSELDGRIKGRFFGLMKRRQAEIETDLVKTQKRLTDWRHDLSERLRDYRSNRATFESEQQKRDELTRRAAGKDRKSAIEEVDVAGKERDSLVSEQREIDAQLTEVANAAIKNAQITGATCTKAYLSIKEIGQVDVVVIDEASMVMLPTVWFVSGMARERAAVCGDFRQIPPIVTTRQQEIFDAIGHDVFEAAGLDPTSTHRMALLNEQHRMDEQICSLISQPMYGGLLRTAPSGVSGAPPTLPAPFDKTLVIVDTSDLWPFESVNAFFSRYNLMHALLVRNLAWYLRQSGYVQDKSCLGICTPYAAESRLIGQLLDGEEIGNVQVGTVHRFQGDERRTVVLDIPEGHGGRGLGQFIQGIPPDSVGAKLLNVAISRAQNHLIIFANLTHLDKLLPSSSLLREILFQVQESGRVVHGSEVLGLRPIHHDLQGLIGHVELDEEAGKLGLFDQRTFDEAFEVDLRAARESIVILSGFVTPRRVAALGDLLRAKVAEGVKVRCVTRPPYRNGTMSPELGREALDMLAAIGCVIDCRASIHEKIVIIDSKVVWHGSLNALSHAHLSDESMTRLVNAGFAGAVAANISKRPYGPERALAAITEAENPRCEKCGSRSVYNDGRYGPYFSCEDQCGWKIDMKRSSSSRRSAASSDEEGTQPELPSDGPKCPECGGKTRLRKGRYGRFYGCLRYPDCRGTVNAGSLKPRNLGEKRRGRSS